VWVASAVIGQVASRLENKKRGRGVQIPAQEIVRSKQGDQERGDIGRDKS